MGELTLVEQVYRRYTPLLERVAVLDGWQAPTVRRLLYRMGREVSLALVRAACREDDDKAQAVTP